MKYLQTGLFISLIFIIILSACKDEYPLIPSEGDLIPVGLHNSDSTDEPSNNDSGRIASPFSAEVLPGKKRLQVNWEVEDVEAIGKTAIFWDNESDSIIVSITSAGDQSTVIDLPEGLYNFTLINYGQEGSKSEEVLVAGRSYGRGYRDSVVENRALDSLRIENNDIVLNWRNELNESAINVLLRYINDDENEIIDTIDMIESRSVINNFKVGEEIKYRTVYRPEGNAIDTFMTSWVTVSYSYSIIVDKSKMKEHPLPNDAPYENIQYLWDGKWSEDADNPYSGNGLGYKGFLTKASMYGGEPVSITIDLGNVVKLDSFHIYLYRQFQQQCLRKYEIWGAKSVDGSGDWDNWTKLIEMENKKPSGSAEGVLTDKDKEAWKDGSGSSLSLSLPKVRYIRVKCLQNYFVYYGEGTSSQDRNNYNFDMAEITFWQIDE